MGIFSFFSQIGNIISSGVDFFINIIKSAIAFISNIVFGFDFLNEFVYYMPGELAIGFRILLSLSVITLIVRLL